MGKDTRTKISTIVAIVAYLNFVLSQFDTSMFEGNPKLMVAYKIISALVAGVAWMNSHYYNQNFTEAGLRGTDYTRQIKREQSEDYIGERFYTDEEGNLEWEGGEEDE